MSSPIFRIVLYVRDMEKVSEFYIAHFGFEREGSSLPDKIALTPPSGGCSLVILRASKGHRIGQSCVKIIFDVEDVEAFKEERARHGLAFGPIHHGPGYQFSNARDPARNLIQISSGHLVD